MYADKINRGTSAYLLLAFATVISAGMCRGATSYDFASLATDSGTGNGNMRTMTSNGLTATMTAWSGNWVSNNLSFNPARLESWNDHGLGVCSNVVEPVNSSGDCQSPEHSVDNNPKRPLRHFDILRLEMGSIRNFGYLAICVCLVGAQGASATIDLTVESATIQWI